MKIVTAALVCSCGTNEKETMSIQQVEVVSPYKHDSELWGKIAGSFVALAIRALVVWWAVAVWFPELGITYWQAILPVYAVRMLVGRSWSPRSVKTTKGK